MTKINNSLHLSGASFQAVYQLSCATEQAACLAEEICIEQTIEFPKALVKRQDIKEQIPGRLVSLTTTSETSHEVTIEYPIEVAGNELPQLLNVLMGNTSLKPGIRLQSFALTPEQYENFKGPRFGRKGLRDLLNAPQRPLVCTALKPMGNSPKELADLAYQFALGGIDIIKDDHGLSNQPFCTFEHRVEQCCAAVQRAVKQTGKSCLYFPNITAPVDKIHDRTIFAKQAGAGGCVISPGLIGLDTMRILAHDDTLSLPILSHPALMGSFTVNAYSGIAHGALYGQIGRLAGADATIFPSYGGRFSTSKTECRDLVEGTARKMGQIKKSFPIPAGGLSFSRIPELIRFYGNDVILLIGGDLHRHGPDLVANCREFVRKVLDIRLV